MMYAPIVLFAYNRPQHLKLTLESLHKNELANESDLYIYIDGPKSNATEEQLQKIEAVKQVANEKQWCKNVNVVEATSNKGLAKSIIEGVTKIVNEFGKVIVVEDDVLLSPYFLRFMNESLDIYKANDDVLTIGSWSYFCPPEKIQEPTYFFRFPDTKGWATFDRAWKLFEEDPQKLMNELKARNLMHVFNAGLKFPYFTNMLNDQIQGRINSWAIRWTAVAVLTEKLSLFPRQTLSKDIGFGDGATHESNTEDFNSHLEIDVHPVVLNYKEVVENKIAVREWANFHTRNFTPEKSWIKGSKNVLKFILPSKSIELLKKLRS